MTASASAQSQRRSGLDNLRRRAENLDGTLIVEHTEQRRDPIAMDDSDVMVSQPIRVFLLDDHEIVRRGLVELMHTTDDLLVVGEAGTAAEALHRIPAAQPDVAILDARLPDGSGIDVCREIRSSARSPTASSSPRTTTTRPCSLP